MAAALLTANAAAGKKMQKTPAQQLIGRLQKLQKKGVMFGHQDALFYGTTWKWEYGRSDVNDVCGDYPAVLGCELGGKYKKWFKAQKEACAAATHAALDEAGVPRSCWDDKPSLLVDGPSRPHLLTVSGFP